MTAINDGGPAFPVWELNGQGQQEMTCFGMTMRDYFAAKAMQALIAKGMDNPQNKNAKGVPVITGFAYEYADAMIKARDVKA